ncbi:OmpH/Skp family outer membrane protein [Mucilaginibacter sp.]
MKRLFKVALVAGCMLLMAGIANAQKIGYVNTNELMQAMPEVKGIQTQMQTYQKSFVDQLTTLNNEYQTKGKAYETGREKMTDAQRTVSESELQDLQKRMQDLQTSASNQVQAKSSELMKPVADKVRTAINAVAKEKGYAYVLDSSQIDLIVAPATDNIQVPVRARLGLK